MRSGDDRYGRLRAADALLGVRGFRNRTAIRAKKGDVRWRIASSNQAVMDRESQQLGLG